jgi:hypothetical protein
MLEYLNSNNQAIWRKNSSVGFKSQTCLNSKLLRNSAVSWHDLSNYPHFLRMNTFPAGIVVPLKSEAYKTLLNLAEGNEYDST